MKHKSISNSGGKMHYRRVGEGPAIVLLHGFCATSHLWDPILMPLNDGYSLLLPDLPGFGESDHFDNANMKWLAVQVKEMLDAEEEDSAILLGHSMGGYIALEFAQLCPERLKGLGLIHSHPYADNEEQNSTRKRAIHLIQEKGAATYVRKFIPGLFASTTDRLIIRAMMASLENQTAEGLIAGHQAMLQREDTSKVLEALNIPVLFINGKHDLIISKERRFDQVALPKVAMLHTLERTGHMGTIEQPREMATAINSFLKILE